MAKSWRCRLGWHHYMRRKGHDNPNHRICVRCGRTRNLDTTNMVGGMG